MLPIMFVFRTLAALVVLIITEVKGANLIYKRVGDFAVLNPGPLSDPISTVIWKHKSDLALDWFGTEIICYRDFKGRCDLDQTSGSLIINNLKPGDSGIYSPEINNKELDKMDLIVLQPVPKPTVSIQCNNEKTLCNLTCEASITAEFGPVAYKWKNEDRVLSNSTELEIKTEKDGSSFICELENVVSNASSEAVTNPVSSGISGINPAAVIVPVLIIIPILIVILIGVVLFLMYKKGYFTRLRTTASGVGRRTSSNEEQGRQWTNVTTLEQGDVLLGETDTRVVCWTRFKTMVYFTRLRTTGCFKKNTQNGAVTTLKVYFTRLRTMGCFKKNTKTSGVGRRTSPNEEQRRQWTNGDVALKEVVPLIGGINTGVETNNSRSDEAPNGHVFNVSPETSSQNEISLEMPKDPNCDQPVVSADVHREPANGSRSNEGDNQNLPDVSPGTSSQTGDVRVDMEDEVQNSGVETENLDQAEPAEESVAVEIPENRDGAEISSQKSSDEETPDRHTKDEDQS